MPASDIRTRPVEIELDRKRALVYDWNAIAVLEEKFGDLDTAIRAFSERPTIKAVRTLLWAGLLHEDPGLTEAQVGSWLRLGDLPRVAEAIRDALVRSGPELDPLVRPAEAAGEQK